MQGNLDRYVKNTADIRELSTPQIGGIDSPQDYSEVLRKNFIEIGNLAKENREILDNDLFPFLSKSRHLTGEEMKVLGEFGDSLLDAYNLDNLDPSMLLQQTEKLLSEAELSGDDDIMIEQLDREVMACYTLVNQTARIYPDPEVSEVFRKRGFSAADKLISYLDHDRFLAISKESREYVIINTRYMWALYERVHLTPEECENNYNMLENALQLAHDKFFLELMPDYNWRNHIFRTYQYMALAIEHQNYRGFSKEILDKICDHLEEMQAMWDSDRDYFKHLASKEEVRLLVLRGRYLSGRIGRTEFFDDILNMYEKRDRTDYDLSGMLMNLNIPAECLATLDSGHITRRQMHKLQSFYHDVLNYAFHMPYHGSLGYMLEYVSAVLEVFIEIPGEITFRDMCLKCLAALHPPTYVHSMMVGMITKCLCRHLLRMQPELFSDMRETKSDEEIILFAYEAALCHDFGKILMIDTIFVYGRKLLDMEFGFIKKHPQVGADMLRRYFSTKDYANVALFHHRWYDGTGGYPSEPLPEPLPEKVIIDIVTCADCMDAATDTVGRSYSKGKTLDEVIAEIEEGAGTRYAPFLPELLRDEEVYSDLSYLLQTGRSDCYKDTYLLLRDLQERSES